MGAQVHQAEGRAVATAHGICQRYVEQCYCVELETKYEQAVRKGDKVGIYIILL